MARFSSQVALGEGLLPVGQLHFTSEASRQFSTFSYSSEWTAHKQAFALAPSLPLEGGPYHAAGQRERAPDALPGAFADAAPDSWGRRLLRRTYGAGLSEFEYLTLSDDMCRQGALRFLDDDGNIIAGKAPDAIPRLVELEAITMIARDYEAGKDVSQEDMQALAGAGGSGGARPKANVREGDRLWLAKFTSLTDESPVERVEVATLRLARACGIKTPEVRLEMADTPYPAALLERFDRRGTARIPYISARTALDKPGTDPGSYTEIVDFLRAHSADPQADFEELYRRLVFTILVSNKDDHLKNHGFLYAGENRWRLSPVFDVNPAPDRNPYLETAIIEGGAHDRSIELALEACDFFEIAEDDAVALIRELAGQLANSWRDALRDTGLSGAETRDYEPAFVHDEAERALAL
ncbi:type II toxin-antitoxin system HipA family toxin [Erythrobacter aureus]|uniref:Type II toxin-antitoxin system HipA family toxin n=1 Tax=Erythrobacter aureus TaxID=2182384 RepID=A0A345YBL2_9SPHN|nr:type II toxin-antitoxin system HipA family toxin [Erythrobacter aureus]AXK41314.1 type II toxin-antitoxin system HipA family toxin [Erythrobacter aureus]